MKDQPFAFFLAVANAFGYGALSETFSDANMPPLKPKKVLKRSTGFPKRDPGTFAVAPGLKVSNGKFVGLDIGPAVAILMKPKSEIYGHRNVLFAGFKAWLLDSRSLVASRHSIASAVAERIAKAEKSKAKVAVDAFRALTRFNPKYRGLYERIYNHIGGMAAIRKAIIFESEADQSRSLSRKQIPALVAMATILDFHVRELLSDKEKFGSPSIQKASLAAHLIIGKDVKKKGRSTAWGYWRDRERAVPFLYGASLVELAPGESILDRLLDNKLSLIQAAPHFEDWFSYSEYFRATVLEQVKLRSRKAGQANRGKRNKLSRFVKIPGVEAKAPKAPFIDDATKAALKVHISEKKPSEKRSQ